MGDVAVAAQGLREEAHPVGRARRGFACTALGRELLLVTSAFVQAKAVGLEELKDEPKSLVEQQEKNKYSRQVGLKNVQFSFDEEKASALEVDGEMSSSTKRSSI